MRKAIKICLFFNGLNHAGENLDDLLKHRDNEDSLKIMSDALSSNKPKKFEQSILSSDGSTKKVITCYCLSHAFRKFEELIEDYEKPCLKITELMSQVYQIDYQTEDMSDADRLVHHQKYSSPILDELHAYLNYLINAKEVEPNDGLGEAIKYTLKHWYKLTQFIRVEGAPLDNNVLERSLKVPIRGRSNWMFYKTTYGAYIGGVLTSIIYTCILSDINPLEYLIAMQKNKDQIVKEPDAWLPWNYQAQLKTETEQAA